MADQLRAQLAELEQETEAREREVSDELAQAGKKKARPRGGAAKKPAARPKYPPEITDAVRRANAARKSEHGGPGAAAHVLVRSVIGDLSVDGILKAAGGLSERKLRTLAAGNADRETLKALHGLYEPIEAAGTPQVVAWCKGRNLASILVAAIEQAKGSK